MTGQEYRISSPQNRSWIQRLVLVIKNNSSENYFFRKKRHIFNNSFVEELGIRSSKERIMKHLSNLLNQIVVARMESGEKE